jgi:hypothetical protein
MNETDLIKNIARIADALERIATALEPTKEGEWPTFYAQVEAIADSAESLDEKGIATFEGT